MGAATPQTPRHSADVRMELHVNGRVLPIAQLGLDSLILEDSIEHPPAEAEIHVSIDGHESCWPVQLDEGLSAARPRTRISRLAEPHCPPAPRNGTSQAG